MSSKKSLEQFDNNYFIEHSCDDIEVNLPEVIENINLYNSILETETISFEQLAYMVLYDTSVFEVNSEKREDLKNVAILFNNKFPNIYKDEFLMQSNLPSFLTDCITKSQKSAKAKKLALGLIRENQKYLEEKGMEDCLGD